MTPAQTSHMRALAAAQGNTLAIGRLGGMSAFWRRAEARQWVKLEVRRVNGRPCTYVTLLYLGQRVAESHGT